MSGPSSVPTPVRDALPDDLDGTLSSLLLDLLGYDTQNPPGDTAGLASFVEDELGDAGIDHRRVVSDPAKPNVVATIDGDRSETLLFEGHLDTVPYDEAAWTREPRGERDGDTIYGRGATDMKGSLAAMLVVARAFATMDEPPPVDLGFVFVGEEEVPGDAGLETVLADDTVDAGACVIGENTCEEGRHSVTVADKGSIWLTLQARGAAAHGSRPSMGQNAIDDLYAAIEDLRGSLTERELALPPAVEPIIEDSVAFYAPALGESAARRLFRYPTVNLGTFEGGESINSVPESATARLDVRLTAGVETPAVLEDIRTCLERHPTVSIAETSWSVGTYESPDGPLVGAVVDAASAVVDERIYRRSATGGGDAKTLRNEGISTVEFALGNDSAHAVDEYTTLEALRANTAVYATVPYRFAERVDRQRDRSN
ncbi:MAG: M20 family metallopeptidase [Halanaeroarchaeum sp.]